jgi:hypothetical protein
MAKIMIILLDAIKPIRLIAIMRIILPLNGI